MKNYANVIICMDDTDRDAPMLAYMAPFLRMANTRKVTLLHVHDPEPDPHTTSVIPNCGTMWEVPVTPSADITEHTRNRMMHLAKTYLDPIPGLRWETVLSDEPEYTEIISQSAHRDADLIVIGRHYDDTRFKSSQAVTARRITEKATCSVLILPESAPPGISSIIVAVRNSECSANALKAAQRIGTAFDARLTALNIFKTPHKGKTEKTHDCLQTLAQEARRDTGLLLQRTGLANSPVITQNLPDAENDPVAVILSQLPEQGNDLIVIGARGRTGAAGILLGAVTEELIQRSPVPVLAVKTKGECVDLLHALLSLLRKR